MNILITGGAGYIGTRLAEALIDAHHHVTIVDNLRYGQGVFAAPVLSRVPFYNMDVCDFISRESMGFDVIYHLAAIVGAPACDKAPLEAGRVNLESVEFLVRRLNQYSYRPRLVFPNSNSGYGKSGLEACTEETPSNAISLYGKTKDAAEQFIANNYNNYTIFRLATVFGTSARTRLDLLINTLVYQAVWDKHIEVFDGNFRRNFIHIGDIVGAFMWCLHTGMAKNQIFNLGNDMLNSTKMELVDAIAKVIPCTITTIPKTDPDQRDYIVSNEKLKRAGFEAQKSLYYGVSQLQEYYRLLPSDAEKRAGLITAFKNT